MRARVRGGYQLPGGIEPYPLERLLEEIAYISYYFHWPLSEVLQLDHADRQCWVEEISAINRRLSEGAGLDERWG